MMNRCPTAAPPTSAGVELHQPGNRGKQHYGQRSVPGPSECGAEIMDSVPPRAVQPRLGECHRGDTRNGSRSQ